MIGLAPAAAAETTWNGSLAVTSDYLVQGLSQTRGEPAVQGGARVEFDDRWTLGTWASSIDRYYDSGTGVEIDLYVARAFRLTQDWIASVTATHYFYPDESRYVSYDYDELTVSLGYRSRIFATLAWSPNYTDISYQGLAVDRSAVSAEFSANQPLAAGWSGNAGIGYRDLSDLFGEGYWYGHAGLMHSAGPLTIHLAYTWVDDVARDLFGHERADATWTGTLIWRFGNFD